MKDIKVLSALRGPGSFTTNQSSGLGGAAPATVGRARFIACLAIQLVLAVVAFRIDRIYIERGDPLKWLHLFFADDTFYYLKIAENFVGSGAFTFDGINDTNGFQPLWMLVLVVIKLCIGHGDLLVATMLFCLALHCTNSVLLGTLVQRATHSLVWSVAAQLLFLGNILLLKANFLLMENTLACTLVLLMALQIQRGKLFAASASHTGHVANGVLLAALVLCRVDYALVLGAMFVGMLLVRRTPLSREMLTTFGMPALALVALSAVNVYYFGRPDLISGYVKHHKYVAEYLSNKTHLEVMQVYGRASVNLVQAVYALTLRTFVENVQQHLRFAVLMLVSGVALSVVWLFFKAPDAKKPAALRTCAILGVAALIHAAAMVAYLPTFIVGSQWYFSLEIVATLAITVIVLATLSARSRFVGLGLVAVVLTAQLFGAVKEAVAYEAQVWTPSDMSPRSQTYRLAAYIAEHTAPDAIIGSYNSGVIGYYSKRRVVNLDGLVNNFEYYERVLALRGPRTAMLGYMRDKGIGYFADFQICTSCTDAEITANASTNTGIPVDHLTLVKVFKTDEVSAPHDDEHRLSGNQMERTVLYLVKVD